MISHLLQHNLQAKITAILLAAALALGALVMVIVYMVIGRLSAEYGLDARAVEFLPPLFMGLGVAVLAGAMVFARFSARLIARPLQDVVAAAERIAASGRPVGQLPLPGDDEFARLCAAFNTMVERLAESYAGLEQRVADRTREFEESQYEAQKAGNLLREAVSSISQGFTIYDENDRLVICNETYKSFYEDSRDLIIPGNSFEEIVRRGAERGQYQQAIGHLDDWVRQRVLQHQAANGQVIEQQLGDGRWLLIVEHRTPSGYIVGNRIDITELKRTTEALRQRELYLRATLDNLPFLFWLKDADSRFLAVNKVFAEACGKDDPVAVAGLSDLDVWPHDLAERYRADDFEVMASRREKTVEEPVAGGSATGWIETFKKPVIAADGAILGTVGFARDISDRKQIEQALAESEQRWDLALRGANDGVWDWNPQTGKVYYSERWKSMLGYAPEAIGDTVDEWLERVHPDDREATLAAVDVHLSGRTEFYQSEHRLRCKDGSYKWILDRGQALFDAAGKPLRMAGSHSDISERRLAEARSRDRTEQLNAVFELSPDGFVSFDTARRIIFVSAAFLRMSGYTETDIVGLSEDEFSQRLAADCIEAARFPGVSQLRAAQKVGAGGTAGDTFRYLIELGSAGKRVLEVGLRLSQGDTVSQILYFRDVTHETEVDRMKSEFLSTAAHELRTPMASIYGYAELLQAQDFAADERHEMLGIIHRQSELMIAIVNELLDLARIEARRGKDFHFKTVDACVLSQEVVAGFKVPGQRNAPQLATADFTCTVRADRNKLTQAISNVLSNAYKYSPAGGPVEFDFLAPQPGVPRLGIRIRDHGIGMTPQQVGRVCERFYRADASGKIPGTGLGMSIVQEIIQLHGGELQIDSTPGVGSAVTLWLPSMTDVPTQAFAVANRAQQYSVIAHNHRIHPPAQ